MTEPGPTIVSMRDLLASCEAAKAVSCPPRAPEDRPEGTRPATAEPRTNGVPAEHPDAA